MEIHEVLAKNIRLRRSKLCLSQEALADAAKLDRTYISGIERGLRNPTISVLAQIADALRVEVFELLQ